MAVTAWSSEIRGTGDVDIMVPVGDEANKARLNKALKKLRAAQLPLEQGGINTTDAEHPTLMFQTRFGKLDILYRPDGSAPYCEIKARAPVRTVAGHAIHVASRDDMVRMKAAGGREREIDDLDTALVGDDQVRLRPTGQTESLGVLANYDKVAVVTGCAVTFLRFMTRYRPVTISQRSKG